MIQYYCVIISGSLSFWRKLAQKNKFFLTFTNEILENPNNLDFSLCEKRFSKKKQGENVAKSENLVILE